MCCKYAALCCNLQHIVVLIKEVAIQINRACKNVLVSSNLSLTFIQFYNTLLQHLWLLHHIAAAPLDAAAS